MATRKKSCCGANSKPWASRNAEETLQISQTEKPRCSAKIDQIRLRLATALPPCSQNVSSSGRQSLIQCPLVAGGRDFAVGSEVSVIAGSWGGSVVPNLPGRCVTTGRTASHLAHVLLTASRGSRPHCDSSPRRPVA